MLDHTDPVASVIPAASLDAAAPENAMTALSRLALGPVNTDYYLAVFDRFDTTGRTTTTWNWAACLATINWMLFRQLWTAALVYVAAAEGLALLLFGVGRSFIHWPPGVELGVLGAFAMLAFVVPGFYGNAILYADIRKRVGRALAASRTLPEAAALLQRQASSRQRLRRLVAANVVLAGDAVAPVSDPEICWFEGGWVGGRVDSQLKLLGMGDESARIIAATGGVLSRAEVKTENEALTAMFDRVSDAMRKGFTTEDMQRAKLLDGLARTWADPDKALYDAHKSMWAHYNKLSHTIV